MQTTTVLSPLSSFAKLPYADCIEACYECASAAWISTDASLNEIDPKVFNESMKRALECAEACALTARTLIFQEQFTAPEIQLRLAHCAEKARACLEECRKHIGEYEHCFILAKCSEICLETCEKYLTK